MKYTLKDYQRDAVDDVLRNLDTARTIYHRDGKDSSFSLTATTGAGKTVMAAAAIEALFYGNDDFDFDADPGAVVIWFSYDPNLNAQSRTRLREASEKFTASDLVTIEPPFARPRLEPGKVYFLNTQRLGRNSLLTRGYVDDPDTAQTRMPAATPDMQGWTIWETIANTIDDDDLTLYLVLDEAHRGFDSKPNGERPTIVRRLVGGHAGHPPAPIVWGISATIERFRSAMQAAEATAARRSLPDVRVDPGRVQESGLVKDTVVLNIPNEAGTFDSVLVREGARRLRQSTERWHKYGSEQKFSDVVQPLLVLQAPNTPNHNDIGLALDTIADEYPEIRGDAVRHVFGDHTMQRFGGWKVDWIEPQRVEETTTVRVLVAKDAISTGWDCPRAEVMVSFRPAKDHTHITQLLGRMVRSPLARRVPGDEHLNAVDCILPFFDRTTAGNVVRFLTGQISDMPGTNKKVLRDPRELTPNPDIHEAVWELWDALPTQTLPQRGARPVRRLVALAQALSADGVRPNALTEVHEEMHRILDAYATRYETQVSEAVEKVWEVELQQIAGTVGKMGLTYRDYTARADDRAIRSLFEAAKKAFGADVAQLYVNHLAGPDGANGDDDGLRDAYVKAAALATVTELRAKVDKEAVELADRWFAEHRVALLALPDIRQQNYAEIRALATEPQRGTLGRPRTRLEDYELELANGQLAVAPSARLHLMADASGDFPLTDLNDWERTVLTTELARRGAVAWYRNPPRTAVDSLGIAYRDHGDWRSLHPDFVFFHDVGGKVVASIVDPHGHHLDDAAIKLKALAQFADRYGADFYRVEAVSRLGNHLRLLDMQRAEVREAVIHGAKKPIELYESDVATDYDSAD